MVFGNGFWDAYPGTDLHEIDLHYVLMQLLRLRKDMQVVIDSQAITFADPITWNITSQYPAYTVVLDDAGNGYLSRQAVPAGIPLSNTTYWTQIFNFNDIADRIRASIALNAGTSATTPEALTKDALVWWRGDIYIALTDMPAGTAFIEGTNVQRYTVDDKFGLYNSLITQLREDLQQEVQDRIEAVEGEAQARADADAALQTEIDELASASAYYAVNVVADMLALEDVKAGAIISTRGYYTPDDGGAGRYFVTETGTIDNRLSYGVAGKVVSLIHADGEIVVNQIGAHGDGVEDDTAAINWALENFQTTHLCADCEYKISSTLTIPYGHNMDGHTATIRTIPMTEFAALAIPDLPVRVAIFLQGREPISHSEFGGYTKFVKGFKLIENTCDLDIEGSDDTVGIYVGYKTALSGTDYTKVNHAVSGYTVSDILICGFRNGIQMRESWGSKYINITIRNFRGEGINMIGQCVNNDFIACDVDGRNGGATLGLYMNVSPTYSQRPEGTKITNCGFYSCAVGVRHWSALSTQFTNCMLDLHKDSAVQIVIGDVFFEGCWISSKTGAANYGISQSTVRLDSVGAADEGNKATFINCHIQNRNDNGGENPGAVMQGQNRYSDIITDCMCGGSVRQLFGNAALRIINNSFEASDTIYTANNGVRSGNYRGATGAAMT